MSAKRLVMILKFTCHKRRIWFRFINKGYGFGCQNGCLRERFQYQVTQYLQIFAKDSVFSSSKKRIKSFLNFSKPRSAQSFSNSFKEMQATDLEKALFESIEEEQVANNELFEVQSAR